MNELDAFILDCACDSINGPGEHRFVEFTQTDGQEVTACADCGVVDE